MSANEIRKTMNLLMEIAKKPTRQDLEQRQTAELLRNAVWIVNDEDADVLIFAPSQKSAEALAECVIEIERAGLSYDVLPDSILTTLTDAWSLLTHTDYDFEQNRYKNEKTLENERMSIGYFPLPYSRVIAWSNAHSKKIPSEQEVDQIIDNVYSQIGEP